MILGIDHIALSSTYDQLSALVQTITNEGYTEYFRADNLRNPDEKKLLLSKYENKHSLIFLRTLNRFGLEITTHGVDTFDLSAAQYIPIFAGMFGSTPEEHQKHIWHNEVVSLVEDAFGCSAVHWRGWHHSQGQFCCIDEESKGLLGVIVPTTSLQISRTFWQGVMGAREVSSGPGWIRLLMSSAVSSWSGTLLLWETGYSGPMMLDASGFPCLALLSSDLHGDSNKIKEAGLVQLTSKAFDLNVGDRKLEVEIIRLETNELIELVSVNQ